MSEEKEIWYCPTTKSHKLCEFSSTNSTDAVQFSSDTICAIKRNNGSFEYYYLRPYSCGVDWQHISEDNEYMIPDELKALALILL